MVRDQFQLNGCNLLPITLSDKGISLDQLECSHAQFVYVTPSYQFPTGSIMPYPERKRLLEWAHARNAYIIEDDSALLNQISLMRQEVFFAPFRVEQWAMTAFFEQGHWYRHIRKVRNLYRKRHHQLIELIETYLGGFVEITGRNSGLHIQLIVKKEVSSEELIQRAAKVGVIVYDLRKMWLNHEQDANQFPRLYMGFVSLTAAEMESGIRLLQKAWNMG